MTRGGGGLYDELRFLSKTFHKNPGTQFCSGSNANIENKRIS
jgi:hypothetical protein